jgi:hypothetical protein
LYFLRGILLPKPCKIFDKAFRQRREIPLDALAFVAKSDHARALKRAGA